MREKMTKRIETCLKEKAKQDEKHKAMCARMFKPLSNTPPKRLYKLYNINPILRPQGQFTG